MTTSKLQKLITTGVDALYFPFIRSIVPLQTFRYGVCGGANLVSDGLIYFIIYNFILCKKFLDFGFIVISPHVAAFALTFPLTFFIGFWLAKHISFQDQRSKTEGQRYRYLLVVVINILIKYFGLKFLIEIALVFPSIANISMTIVTVVISYLLQRNFTFRKVK